MAENTEGKGAPPGYERDTESGLDNAQARYNSSSLGRFMSPDPLGNFVADATNPQTWNLYTYVNNNPLAFIDPTGTEGCEWSAASICEADNNLGDFTIPPIIVQSNPPTCWGASCDAPWTWPDPPTPAPPTSGGGGGGGTKGTGVCPLNSAGISACIAAPPPPQSPPSSKQACVNNFYSSNLGKTTEFMSPLSMIPGWGPRPLQSTVEDTAGLAGKYGAVQAGKAAAGASIVSLGGESPIAGGMDWLLGKVATGIESLASKAALPALGLAAAVDLLAHDVCDPSVPIPAPSPF